LLPSKSYPFIEGLTKAECREKAKADESMKFYRLEDLMVAEILIPEDKFLRLKNENKSHEEMAKFFQVPISLIETREYALQAEESTIDPTTPNVSP
jgi:hypothetical protein